MTRTQDVDQLAGAIRRLIEALIAGDQRPDWFSSRLNRCPSGSARCVARCARREGKGECG